MANLQLSDVLTNVPVSKHAFDLDTIEQISASKHLRDNENSNENDVEDLDDSWYKKFELQTIDDLNNAKLQSNTKGNFGTIRVNEGDGQNNILITSGLHEDDQLFDENVIYPEGSYEKDDSEQIHIRELTDEFLSRGEIEVDELEIDTDRTFTDSDETDNESSEEFDNLDNDYSKKKSFASDNTDNEFIEFSDDESFQSYDETEKYAKNESDELFIDDYFVAGYGLKNNSENKNKQFSN